MGTMARSLEDAREAFAHRAWRDAYDILAAADRDGALTVDDLELLATAAQLIASDDFADRWARAHQACLDQGEPLRAARCAYWLAFALLTDGELAQGGGWAARAHQAVGDSDCVERGYLLIPEGIACCDTDPRSALQQFTAAGEIAERFADDDLAAMAHMSQAQALVCLGRCAQALPLIDESMVAVTADEVSPIVAGLVFCGVIDACQRAFEYRRAAEWTAALSRWCETQPDLAPFRGQCLIHRAEVMQLRGDWPDAVEEAINACEHLRGAPALGDALYRTAELARLRGELEAAETAYREAAHAGREPQPGLALLRLAQGDVDTAVAAIRRALGEPLDPMTRARILAPATEVLLAAGAVDEARVAADELAAIADENGSSFLQALALHAGGSATLAEGDPGGALASLRGAWARWRDLGIPYEAAKARVLVGLAFRSLGDTDTATMELDAARLGFESLGAAPDVADVEGLLQRAEAPAPAGLTRREVEVLALVAAGNTNRQIAVALVISEHTVARHVQNIFTKLGVTTRTAAAAFAHRHGLV